LPKCLFALFGLVAAQRCDLQELEANLLDAQWWMEDSLDWVEWDCPNGEPVADEINLDRVPRGLNRMECSLAVSGAECARKQAQYRRLASSWQSRVKRQAAGYIKQKQWCDDAMAEYNRAQDAHEKAEFALKACQEAQDPVYMPTATCGGTFSGHPYIYDSRDAALSGCKARGCSRLCSRKELDGHERCASGWLSDGKGYWMSQTYRGCGSGRGFRGWGSGNNGAYCCDCSPCTQREREPAPVYMPSATCGGAPPGHPYIYSTREAALDGCKARGCSRLCQRAELTYHSRCSSGWLSDGKGYWMNAKDARPACGGGGEGYKSWGSGKNGAYCCDCNLCNA